MMHISTLGDGLVFAGCVVFTVCTLVALQQWSANTAWRKTVYMAAGGLGLVFAAMLTSGALALRDGPPSFLGLSLLLCGAAGGAILAGMVLRREGWQQSELRRLNAHDL